MNDTILINQNRKWLLLINHNTIYHNFRFIICFAQLRYLKLILICSTQVLFRICKIELLIFMNLNIIYQHFQFLICFVCHRYLNLIHENLINTVTKIPPVMRLVFKNLQKHILNKWPDNQFKVRFYNYTICLYFSVFKFEILSFDSKK